MTYNKPVLSIDDQIRLLRRRGMEFADEQEAKRVLSFISYYRLSAYFVRYKEADDRYRRGCRFEEAITTYDFDRLLRLLLLDAVERIEVALRCAMTSQIAMRYGPFGHLSPRNFAPWFAADHKGLLSELRLEERRSHETFVEHFRRKYTAEPDLPIWMASELLSFGAVSRLFRALHPDLKREIGKLFGAKDFILGSWFHTLSYARNVCAHHCRLWNRVLGIPPKLPTRDRGWLYEIPAPNRTYTVLVICAHMIMRIAPGASWCKRVVELLQTHEDLPLSEMGCPAGWQTKAPWV